MGDRNYILFLFLFIPFTAFTAELTWTPPTTLEDGSPMQDGVLHYTVYRSDTQTGIKTKLADPITPVFTLNDADKTKWFHVTATGTAGESQPASIYRMPPAAVTQMKIITIITMGDQ